MEKINAADIIVKEIAYPMGDITLGILKRALKEIFMVQVDTIYGVVGEAVRLMGFRPVLLERPYDIANEVQLVIQNYFYD